MGEVELKTQDVRPPVSAAEPPATSRQRDLGARFERWQANALVEPDETGRLVNQILQKTRVEGSSAERVQTREMTRSWLRGLSDTQLSLILVEARRAVNGGSVVALVEPILQARELAAPNLPAQVPAQTTGDNPALAPPTDAGASVRGPALTAPASFRPGVDIEADANRAFQYLSGRGETSRTFRDVFYGASKADQTAIMNRAGELLVADSTARFGQAPTLTPSQAFMGQLRLRTSEYERRLFQALLTNGDSRYAPEDEVYLHVTGLGTNVDGLAETLGRYSRSEQSQIAARYRARYGQDMTTMLHDPVWGELGGDESVRIRLMQDQDRPGDGATAFAIYQQTRGRSGVDMRALFNSLESAGARFPQIQALYRQATGNELVGDVTDKFRGPFGLQDAGSTGDWQRRTMALLERRNDVYLGSTARLFLAGGVDATEMIRALERFYGNGRVSPEQLQSAFREAGGGGDALEQMRARSPQVAAVLGASQPSGDAPGSELGTIAMDLKRALEGRGTDRGPNVSRLLARVPAERREEFGRLFQQMHGVSVAQAIESGFTSRAASKGAITTELPWRARLLREASDGVDAVGLLQQVGARAANPDELVSTIAHLPLEARATYQRDYDARFGAGAYESAVASLDSEHQRALRLHIGMGRDDVRGLWDGQRRPEGTWEAASAFMMNNFGFTGEFLDASVRDFFIESQNLSRRIDRDGEVSVAEIARYRSAYNTMVQRFEAYDREKHHVASRVGDSAAAVAGVAVSLASGGSLSPLMLLAGAGAAGTVSAGVTALTLGADATPEQLANAAFRGAAFEAGGQLIAGGVVRVGGRLVRIVGRSAPGAEPVVEAAATGAARVSPRVQEEVSLYGAVSRVANAAGWYGDDVAMMVHGVGSLRRSEAELLRGISARLEAGQPLTGDLARATAILRRLAEAQPGARSVLSAADVAANPALLSGRNPGEVQQLLGLDGPRWRMSHGTEWEHVDATSGVSMRYSSDGRWAVARAGEAPQVVPAVPRLAYRPSSEVPPQFRAAVDEAQLAQIPVIEGGEMALTGSRSAYMQFDAQLPGYARFTMPDGTRAFSMTPIGGGNAFDALAAIRRFEEVTGRRDIMARPIGIHFFDGQPRLIFEDLGGARVANKFSELPADIQAVWRRILTPSALRAIETTGWNSFGRTLETDYLFMVDGRLRMGLPVRATDFGQALPRLFQRDPG